MSRLASLSSTIRISGGLRTVSSSGRQILAHLGKEIARAEGLGDVAVAAGRARLGLVAAQRVGGDGDDGDRLEIGLPLIRRVAS